MSINSKLCALSKWAYNYYASKRQEITRCTASTLSPTRELNTWCYTITWSQVTPQHFASSNSIPPTTCMYQFKLPVERGNVRVQCIFTQENDIVILANKQTLTNDQRPKTLDHANSRAIKCSQASWSGEISSTNMATVMGWNTNLATLLINFIFNSINLLKKVAQAINLVVGNKKDSWWRIKNYIKTGSLACIADLWS